MSRTKSVRKRRGYGVELKEEAVQMLLDGHSARSVASNLGLSGTSLLYRWKSKSLETSGPVATKLEARVAELEGEWPTATSTCCRRGRNRPKRLETMGWGRFPPGTNARRSVPACEVATIL